MDSRTILVACLVATLHFLHGASGASSWGYFGNIGPSHWSSVSANCNGNKQSPIDIDPTTTVMDSSLPAFQYTGFDSTTSMTLSLVNNGHTAQLNILGGTVKVSGGGLPAEYTAAQLHFHWGKTDSVGSEHLFEGKHFPMEMHIVTYKTSYGGLGEAVKHTDGLAVLGFFFQIGDTEHQGFKKIIDVLPEIVAKDATQSVTAFKIDELLPASHNDFYRYSGSLTTPTCNEVVTWTVFAETIKITAAQMAVFRTLEAGETNAAGNHKMYNNYRPVQQLHGRTVKVNFNPNNGFRPSINLSLMILPVLSFLVKRIL